MMLFERVKELAENKKISLLSLNEKAGLGKNAIYKWKTQNPSIENLQKVADVLGVSIDYLLGKTDNPSTSAKPKEVDIEDESVLMTFDGKPIPEEDMEIIKRLLRGK
ncbi:helix-turn-helix domain-containing protein [Latilactobacillus sakei]|uniref:helix-turn-helix domain-containing protein n=1 Tax=Latilactobacillus sakei TaxID=1599 RepID=UPI000DC64A86|nr:helix-turn-helix transcriptional regulator [Latilactobacillus sakei]SPS04295.1 Helix-turn-helix domain protein [Latilactobacillus sakei]